MLTKVEVGGTTHYRWRDEDRLDSLYGPGVSVKYQYDADGRRVKDSTGSTVRQYLIDPLLPYGQVIAETDGSNSLVSEYVYGQDRVSLRRSGAAHYYLADGQGSTRLLIDSTGTATDSTVYTAFGETLFSSGSTPNGFLYTGEQADANAGFYYLRARWMDPTVGRFASVDAYNGDPCAPISLHRYLYGNQSPISTSDPSGNISLTDITIAFVMVGTLYNLAHQQFLMTSHYVSERNNFAPILWEGTFESGTWGPNSFGPEGGVILAHLGTNKRDGTQFKVDCTIYLAGLTFSAPPLSALAGELDVTTPGIFGYSPWALSGPVTFLSATASVGIGKSAGVLHIGSGMGDFSLASTVIGYDLGFDWLEGVSMAVERK
jgi:RHS repeat-associated protein